MVRGRSPLRLDLRAAEGEILRFIRRQVKQAGAAGVVVGLSGGIDSSVVGALCVKALGKEKVVALLMPSDFTPEEDVDDAALLAERWGVQNFRIDISKIAELFYSAIQLKGTKVSRANVLARIRMTLCYFVSNSMGLLVAGTGDKSEDTLGYFTKGGDGGVDFLPIAHLYKTQVRELGARLGLPERVVRKPASPQLWPGHRASDELPADYDRLDPLLFFMFEKDLPPSEAATKAGVSVDVAKRVLQMRDSSAHKRALPPMVRPW